MQLFVRNLESRSIGYELSLSSTVGDLKDSIQAHDRIPRACQGLVYAGRQLQDGSTLGTCGLGSGSTVHLVLRLVGGKGGFGALLRGQGRNGDVTTNFDACRDLNGRRLRHADASKKLNEWRACAGDREAKEAADKALRQKEKADKREHDAEIDETQVRNEQKRATAKVLDAVHSALRSLPAPDGGKRKAEAATAAAAAASAASAKRSKVMSALEAVSSDDESSEEAEDTVA